jgi:hypothetical protein
MRRTNGGVAGLNLYANIHPCIEGDMHSGNLYQDRFWQEPWSPWARWPGSTRRLRPDRRTFDGDL